MTPLIDGWVHPRFHLVRDAFALNLRKYAEIGAACAVYVDGRPVVDLYAGLADYVGGRVWCSDTIQVVLSPSKAVAALCLLLLVDRGSIDLDAPVARYWPEFGVNGKHEISVRWVLAHRAALAEIEGELSFDDVVRWDPVVEAIAAQPPNWKPGPWHAHHVRSSGWLIGEIVRRVTGRSLGRFFAEEIAGPLELDFWFGLPAHEEPRVGRLMFPKPPDPATKQRLESISRYGTFVRRVLTGPNELFAYEEIWNQPRTRAAEIPSSNGTGSARALARLFAALVSPVDGTRLLRDEALAAACTIQAQGFDHVLLAPTTFGLGLMLGPTLGPLARPGCFGFNSGGGATVFVDPRELLSFTYVPNRIGGPDGERRAQNLLRATLASLESFRSDR